MPVLAEGEGICRSASGLAPLSIFIPIFSLFSLNHLYVLSVTLKCKICLSLHLNSSVLFLIHVCFKYVSLPLTHALYFITPHSFLIPAFISVPVCLFLSFVSALVIALLSFIHRISTVLLMCFQHFHLICLLWLAHSLSHILFPPSFPLSQFPR